MEIEINEITEDNKYRVHLSYSYYGNNWAFANIAIDDVHDMKVTTSWDSKMITDVTSNYYRRSKKKTRQILKEALDKYYNSLANQRDAAVDKAIETCKEQRLRVEKVRLKAAE